MDMKRWTFVLAVAAAALMLSPDASALQGGKKKTVAFTASITSFNSVPPEPEPAPGGRAAAPRTGPGPCSSV